MELSLKLIILDKMKVFYYYFQYIKNKTGSIIYMGLKKK